MDLLAKISELVREIKHLRKRNVELEAKLRASEVQQDKLKETNKELESKLSRALLANSVLEAEGRETAKKSVRAMIVAIDRCMHQLKYSSANTKGQVNRHE